MNFPPINLQGFEAREDRLKAIKRYDDPYFGQMFYRTSDWEHSWRVLWIFESIAEQTLAVYRDFDVHFARTLALVHDDAEMITGDVQLFRKEQMTLAEKAELARQEVLAMETLAAEFPQYCNGYNYAELLHAAQGKERLEAQVVSYCDKFDGFGEALHEVWAGNHSFLRPVQGRNKDGGYISRLAEFSGKYHSLRDLLNMEHPIFRVTRINFDLIAERGEPHTPESAVRDSSYAPYEYWKKTVVEHLGLASLIEQKEV